MLPKGLRRMRIFAPPACLLALVAFAISAHATPTPHPAVQGSLTPARLQTDASPNPLGVDTAHPHLTWTLALRDPLARNLTQTAYRILVASSRAELGRNHGDLWDSQKIVSPSLGADYQGQALKPAATYYWKAAVWDQDGRLSSWSAPASFITGLTDWSAHWVAATPDAAALPKRTDDVSVLQDPTGPLPIFRHEFSTAKPIRQATLFVSGLGQYEVHLNGQPITSTVLNPGWTDYSKTILYNTYDVTKLMQRGRNAFGVLLGNGMYNVEGTKGRYTKFIGSYGQPKFTLQLQIEYLDGSTGAVVSDKSWKATSGPITFSSTYGGEDYDAQREQPGWDRPGFHESTWSPVLEVASPGGRLTSQRIPPIAVDREFLPQKITRPKPGVLVYDLGQNFSGWPEIRVHGPRGASVTLTCGELLDKDGLVSQHSANASPESANRFTYTLKGSGVETWHPRFSYWGFRYVQVEGATVSPSTAHSQPKPQVLALKGQFLHAAVPVIGHFTTSNQLFAKIHKLIDMAILSNMVSVLTDCPHREKLGWLEQTHLAGPSILYNYDAAQFYAKMAHDMRDSQLADGMVPGIAPEYVAFLDHKGKSNAFRDSPEWGSASILSPWTAYTFDGDRVLLADNYKTMVDYASYLKSKLQDGMLTYGLGDWYDIGGGPPGFSQLTAQGMTATATYYEDLNALAQIATILGKDADATNFRQQTATIRDSINAHLLHQEEGFYDRNSQTANAMPLALGIVPSEQEEPVLDHLIADIHQHQDHVTAGDIGYHYLVRALTDAGRSDVLNVMLQRTDSPSYGYQLKNGATTLTEAWDTNPDSSQNHFMLGHAEEWFYRGLAGIDFDLSRSAPRQIIIHPAFVPGTNSAAATFDSVLGPIASSWRRTGKQITLDVTIPAGAMATIELPNNADESTLESGRPIKDVKGIRIIRTHTREVYVIGSGRYHFQFTE